ncbi:MAG: DUF1775 domain-containing protein [Marinosulfonomonas sp.]
MLKYIVPALGLVVVAAQAEAHATLEQKTALIGQTTKITLRVPHGCDGEATQSVRIDLPEGVYVAKPMPKAGWTLTTQKGDYAKPYNSHGTEVTNGVKTIIWSEGNLPSDWYDEFTFRAAITGTPDEVLYFPAVQDCANGIADWTDTSGSHDVPNPAPSLTLVAGETQGHDMEGMKHHDAMASGETQIGDLILKGGFSRATLPNAPVAGGFLEITNSGTTDDRLIGATSAAAGRLEIHEMSMENDVMRMRKLENGVLIPAGETVTLKPGGFHIMFFDLKQPFVEGDTVDVELTFKTAGTVDFPLAIGAPNAKSSAHMDHSAHGDTAASSE